MSRAKQRPYPKGILTKRWNRNFKLDSGQLDPKEIETGKQIYFFDREGLLTPESERQYVEIVLAAFEFYRVKYFDWQHLATALMFNHIPALQRSKGVSRGRPKKRPLDHLLWLSRANHIIESSKKRLKRSDVILSLSKTYKKAPSEIKALLSRAEKWSAKEKSEFSRRLELTNLRTALNQQKSPPTEASPDTAKRKLPAMTVHKLYYL